MNTEKLRSYCLSFPCATEGIKWEDHLCFMIGAKMFCITGLDDSASVRIKVTEEDFEKLTEKEGIIPSPYLAKNQWIAIEKPTALKPKEWEHYLRQSYELIKSKLTKKAQKEIG